MIWYNVYIGEFMLEKIFYILSVACLAGNINPGDWQFLSPLEMMKSSPAINEQETYEKTSDLVERLRKSTKLTDLDKITIEFNKNRRHYGGIFKEEVKSKTDIENLNLLQKNIFDLTLDLIKNTPIPEKYHKLSSDTIPVTMVLDFMLKAFRNSLTKKTTHTPLGILASGYYNSRNYQQDLERLFPILLNSLGVEPSIELEKFDGEKIKHYPQFIKYDSFSKTIFLNSWHFYAITKNNINAKYVTDMGGPGKVVQLRKAIGKYKNGADLRLIYYEGKTPAEDRYVIEIREFGYIYSENKEVVTAYTFDELAAFLIKFAGQYS